MECRADSRADFVETPACGGNDISSSDAPQAAFTQPQAGAHNELIEEPNAEPSAYFRG